MAGIPVKVTLQEVDSAKTYIAVLNYGLVPKIHTIALPSGNCEIYEETNH